jgi:hypothetical protein
MQSSKSPPTDLPRLDAIEREAWSQSLRAISSAPLQCRANFAEISRRHEAWWNHDCIDRPLFLAIANSNPARRITRRLELLDQPEAWLREKLLDMRQKHWVGDTLPNVRVDFGAVMLGGLLGGRTEFGADTTWTHAFINDDWSNVPLWQIDETHPWWRMLTTLLRLVAQDCVGKYVLCTPDLGGAADVLMNLRGPDNLCIDVCDQPQRVQQAINAIHNAWRRAFCEFYRIATAAGAPIFHWLGLWSDQPYVISACDFNYLIGPREFESILLPEIEKQAKAVGRAVFHLDGPGATRHIDALLEVDALDAIQFVPGSGSPSALRWMPMFRKIQAHGRSALITCPSHEVEEVCAQLRPQGLCIMLSDAPAPAELDALFVRFCNRYGVAA